jgi:arabinogalactan oligomer/maltooligosaccharide transport system substrate-binding protein
VVLWHAYPPGGDERAALEEVVDAYNRESDDTRIKLVSVAYNAFADKITNSIPNGNGPDLFIFAHDRIGDWVAADLLEPIEYYVDDSLADTFAYDAIAALAYHGSLFGLPLAVKSVALFYRTDLVEDPPRTTDELRAMAEVLKENSGGRYVLAYPNTDLYGHAPWLHGFGGRVFDDAGALTLATPEATAALEFARSIANGEHISPKESTATMVATLFNEGRAAMAVSGPWFIADIREGVPWAVTTLPVISETGKPAAPFLSTEGVLMSVRARDKDAAFEVMRALAGDASAIARAKRARQVVPNVAAYRDKDVGGDPVLAAFREQLEHTVPMPATPEMRMVWTPYKNVLQKVIAQDANPSDSLLAVQREIEGYIRGAGGR